MSRIRTIKPEFFRSRALAKCSVYARVTYAGLWCEADDHGRGIADARLLKGSTWPLDDDVTPTVIEGHLKELTLSGHIVLYAVDNDVFYEINRWTEHQSAAFRRGNAVHPAPPAVPYPVTVAEECKKVRESIDGVLDRKGREQGTGNITSVSSAGPFTKDFDVWWDGYPRKVSRQDALKAYRARRREGVDAGKLTQARDNYATCQVGVDAQFVKHGGSFLAKDGMWTEWVAGCPEAPAVVAKPAWVLPEVRRCKLCANTGNYVKSGAVTPCKAHVYA